MGVQSHLEEEIDPFYQFQEGDDNQFYYDERGIQYHLNDNLYLENLTLNLEDVGQQNSQFNSEANIIHQEQNEINQQDLRIQIHSENNFILRVHPRRTYFSIEYLFFEIELLILESRVLVNQLHNQQYQLCHHQKLLKYQKNIEYKPKKAQLKIIRYQQITTKVYPIQLSKLKYKLFGIQSNHLSDDKQIY